MLIQKAGPIPIVKKTPTGGRRIPRIIRNKLFISSLLLLAKLTLTLLFRESGLLTSILRIISYQLFLLFKGTANTFNITVNLAVA